ncbi:hypothetical protein JL720_16242 [Aureococcus anophagefferens]|nr:hypothetical protein JL720_16242 [Aureococcus anophagefferens]
MAGDAQAQACALCFMVMSIALYFAGYRIYASEGFWRTYAFYKALGPRRRPASSPWSRPGRRRVSYEAVAAIILDDTGKTVDDLEDFAREPVGSASIAQAHKAALSGRSRRRRGRVPWLAAGADRTVVVKIQYPEIARLYRVDFETSSTSRSSSRSRARRDLRFAGAPPRGARLREAWNLKTVGANMAKAGFAPSRVVVPQPVPGLVSPCVLAMQYLEGPSLKNVINEHLEERAKFYGFDDVLKMKMFVQKQAKQDRDDALYRREHGGEEPPEEVELGLEEDTLGVETGGGPNLEKLRVNLYRERAPLTNAVARVGVAMGRLDRDRVAPGGRRGQGGAPRAADVRLEELVDTLVEVHGHQLLSDGLVNLDPHPGNVLWQGIAARVLADEFGAAPPRKPPPGEETKES